MLQFTMSDDDSSDGDKPDRVAGEIRKLRWTIIGCTVSIIVVLTGAPVTVSLLLVVSLAGACAYSLLQVIFKACDFFNARAVARGGSVRPGK
jgi:hypothetical protein